MKEKFEERIKELEEKIAMVRSPFYRGRADLKLIKKSLKVNVALLSMLDPENELAEKHLKTEDVNNYVYGI